jgi:hypothetical protein
MQLAHNTTALRSPIAIPVEQVTCRIGSDARVYPIALSRVGIVGTTSSFPIRSRHAVMPHLTAIAGREESVAIEICTRLPGTGMSPFEVWSRLSLERLPILVVPLTFDAASLLDCPIIYRPETAEEFRNNVSTAFRRQKLSAARIFLSFEPHECRQ